MKAFFIYDVSIDVSGLQGCRGTLEEGRWVTEKDQAYINRHQAIFREKKVIVKKYFLLKSLLNGKNYPALIKYSHIANWS